MSNSGKLKPEELNPGVILVDKEAPDILNKTIGYNCERYEIGLPWKKQLRIENNHFAALSRLKSFHNQLSDNIQLRVA